jgi:dTDP-4-amino-4,6-dideoxygalactose transaminase
MIVTLDPVLAQRLRLRRSHGMTRDPAMMGLEPGGPWFYEQVNLGFNYRMTDFHASLGRCRSWTVLSPCTRDVSFG